uniref:Uncharacterized protein n=1 Tax=Candidatus Kentrum sp. TC TaxID=2126339 RepID=A0A450Z407_9GAMM|nr:MAG: hypothetical protein BECKTC1821D_GA0114238_10619 [Candidatus Kentron sp. TC]
MLTLLGSLLGFLSSAFPEFLKSGVIMQTANMSWPFWIARRKRNTKAIQNA